METAIGAALAIGVIISTGAFITGYEIARAAEGWRWIESGLEKKPIECKGIKWQVTRFEEPNNPKV